MRTSAAVTSGSAPVVRTVKFRRMTWLNGLMTASSTVTVALAAWLTCGRMKPLKKAELVTTNQATTSNRIRAPENLKMIRDQRRRPPDAESEDCVSFIKKRFCNSSDENNGGTLRLANLFSRKFLGVRAVASLFGLSRRPRVIPSGVESSHHSRRVHH